MHQDPKLIVELSLKEKNVRNAVVVLKWPLKFIGCASRLPEQISLSCFVVTEMNCSCPIKRLFLPEIRSRTIEKTGKWLPNAVEIDRLRLYREVPVLGKRNALVIYFRLKFTVCTFLLFFLFHNRIKSRSLPNRECINRSFSYNRNPAAGTVRRTNDTGKQNYFVPPFPADCVVKMPLVLVRHV